MATESGFGRRTLFRGGLTVTAAGALAAATPAVAGAASRQSAPEIIGTGEWGARPPNGTITVENHRPTYFVVHHTVEPGNVTEYTRERAYRCAREIQNLHMDRNGWIDSGQQLTNSRGGYLLEGRHRSLEVLRGGYQHVQGAHVLNYNSQAIGVENEGNYMEAQVPQALWDSLVRLACYVCAQYGIQPEQIKAHRDFNSTLCPGDLLYARMDELRAEVGRAVGQPFIPRAGWPVLIPGSTGARVLAAQHLLRAQGASGVPTDGVFGPSTRKAVAQFASAHGLARHSCTATLRTDESGYLGADIWPLITPPVRPGTSDEASRAAAVLADAAGTRALSFSALSQQAWRELLAAA